MRFATLILLTIGIEAVPNDAAVAAQKSREQSIDAKVDLWIDGGEARFGIDYKTKYSVKNQNEQLLLQQYCIDLYDGDVHVGTYYWWNEYGDGLASAETHLIHNVDVKAGWRAVLTVRYFDVGWRDGKRTEEELSHWFRHTFWKFNSIVPKGTRSQVYKLQSKPGMPDFGQYLRDSDFKVNHVLLLKAEVKQIRKKSKPASK